MISQYTNNMKRNIDEAFNKVRHRVKKIKDRALEPFVNEDGVGLVEIALIIIVIIGLAYVFKEQVNTLLENIFSNMDYSNLM